ncbi:hypothetical protein ACU4GR_12390 [Methylobacterium oryzae CBMB20]
MSRTGSHRLPRGNDEPLASPSVLTMYQTVAVLFAFILAYSLVAVPLGAAPWRAPWSSRPSASLPGRPAWTSSR